jgi:hypothetical protein
MGQTVKKWIVASAIVGALSLGGGGASAGVTVVTFDDLTGSGQLADGYGGITWNGDWSYYDAPQGQYTPASGAERIFNSPNGGGDYVQDDAFNFTHPVVFKGAYFSGYDITDVTFLLYDGGTLVGTSSSLAPSATPTFLSSGYSGLVDKVVVNDSGYEGLFDYYVMDNVTFQTGGIPEPATWAMTLLGVAMIGGGLRMARRERAATATA